MSKYSGKCDIYDWFGMIACNEGETPFECFKRLNAKIYLRDKRVPVEINKPSDLVLFYPFIDAVHSHSLKDNSDNHFLPKGSYLVDILSYNPTAVAGALQDLLDEYWRVKEEEDPKYGL